MKQCCASFLMQQIITVMRLLMNIKFKVLKKPVFIFRGAFQTEPKVVQFGLTSVELFLTDQSLGGQQMFLYFISAFEASKKQTPQLTSLVRVVIIIL